MVTGNPPSNFHCALAPSSQERPTGFLLFLLAESKSLTRSNFEKEGFILACISRFRHSLTASPVSGGKCQRQHKDLYCSDLRALKSLAMKKHWHDLRNLGDVLLNIQGEGMTQTHCMRVHGPPDMLYLSSPQGNEGWGNDCPCSAWL